MLNKLKNRKISLLKYPKILIVIFLGVACFFISTPEKARATLSGAYWSFTTKAKANQPPIAVATAGGVCGDYSPQYPPGTTVTLTSDDPQCKSYDPDGTIKTSGWDRTSNGDYEIMCGGASCTTTYVYNALSTATLRVTDNLGATAIDTVYINICVPACDEDIDCGFLQKCINPGTCDAHCKTVIIPRFWREILPKFD